MTDVCSPGTENDARRRQGVRQQWSPSAFARRGFTLVEILIVLLIVGIAGAGIVSVIRTPGVRAAANSYQALIQQARLEAVKRNRPVAVVFDGSARFDVLVYSANTLATCAAATTTMLETLMLSDYRATTVTSNMTGNGIIWLPSGHARDCNAGGAVASQTTFTDGSTTLVVDLSNGGRVEIQ